MKNNKVLTGLSVLALCTALATPTLATNSPNGNLYNDNQVYSVNGYTNYAEMIKRDRIVWNHQWCGRWFG